MKNITYRSAVAVGLAGSLLAIGVPTVATAAPQDAPSASGAARSSAPSFALTPPDDFVVGEVLVLSGTGTPGTTVSSIVIDAAKRPITAARTTVRADGRWKAATDAVLPSTAAGVLVSDGSGSWQETVLRAAEQSDDYTITSPKTFTPGDCAVFSGSGKSGDEVRIRVLRDGQGLTIAHGYVVNGRWSVSTRQALPDVASLDVEFSIGWNGAGSHEETFEITRN